MQPALKPDTPGSKENDVISLGHAHQGLVSKDDSASEKPRGIYPLSHHSHMGMGALKMSLPNFKMYHTVFFFEGFLHTHGETMNFLKKPSDGRSSDTT